MIPTTRDKLISAVAEGLGDIAAGNLSVTEDRLKLVDFAAPDGQKPNTEIVITGPKSPPISAVDDLSGKTAHVRKASSYFESLTALNDRFRKEGKPEVKLLLVSDALEDEDMMEMLS
jgi:ABC-type amino acid transport substrate-binding protein